MSSPDKLSTSSSDCSEIGTDPGTLLNGGLNGLSNPTIGAGIPISVFYCRVGASPQAQQSNSSSNNPGLNGITLSSLGLTSLSGGGPSTDERCVVKMIKFQLVELLQNLNPHQQISFLIAKFFLGLMQSSGMRTERFALFLLFS